MFGLTYLSGGGCPVTLDKLKRHLRLNLTDEDDLLQSHLNAATTVFEAQTQRSLLTTNWRMTLDRFPTNFPAIIYLPRAPVSQVVSFKYYDADDTLQTWDASNYYTDFSKEPARIIAKQIQPVLPPIITYVKQPIIEITFKAGYGSADDCPDLAKQGILLLAAEWYRSRETLTARTTELPYGFQAVCNLYRLNMTTTWGQE